MKLCYIKKKEVAKVQMLFSLTEVRWYLLPPSRFCFHLYPFVGWLVCQQDGGRVSALKIVRRVQMLLDDPTST